MQQGVTYLGLQHTWAHIDMGIRSRINWDRGSDGVNVHEGTSTEWGLPHALDSTETGITLEQLLALLCCTSTCSYPIVQAGVHVASSSGDRSRVE